MRARTCAFSELQQLFPEKQSIGALGENKRTILGKTTLEDEVLTGLQMPPHIAIGDGGNAQEKHGDQEKKAEAVAVPGGAVLSELSGC